MASQGMLYVCAGLMLLIACGGFTLFGFSFAERNRLDPFWETMVCHTDDVYVSGRSYDIPSYTPEQLGLNSSDATDMAAYPTMIQAMTIISFQGWTSKQCNNTNQVKVDTGTTSNGTVWIEYPDGITGGTQLLEVGESWIPAATFPIEGSGSAVTWNTFAVNGSVAYWASTQASVNVIFTINYKTTSSIEFFGMEMSSVSEGVSWCGYKANFLTSAMGASECEDSYEELLEVIPELGDDQAPNKMTGTKKDIEATEQLRDLVCGALMAVGLLLGLGCPACAGYMIWRSLRSKRAQRLDESKSGDLQDSELSGNRDLEDGKVVEPAPLPEKKMIEDYERQAEAKADVWEADGFTTTEGRWTA